MTANCILCSVLLLLALPLSAQDRGLRSVRLTSGQEVELYSASHALVIGVTSYVHWDRLINPVRDAHEVGAALERQGFDVSRLDDPDAETLRGRLNAFAYGDAGRDRKARLVVFFAGHGHTEKTASGQRGFILPRDAPRPEDDRVAFMSKAISMEDIEELATGMLAKHVLFIFDSCFSGTLLRGEAHPGPITRMTTKKVRQFITAGSAAEQVPDESVFQTSLLNALLGDADQTGDGYVTGEELGWYLKGKVMEYSRGAQTPQYGKINDPNLDQGDMVFVVASSGPISPPSSPTTAPSEADPIVGIWVSGPTRRRIGVTLTDTWIFRQDRTAQLLRRYHFGDGTMHGVVGTYTYRLLRGRFSYKGTWCSQDADAPKCITHGYTEDYLISQDETGVDILTVVSRDGSIKKYKRQ